MGQLNGNVLKPLIELPTKQDECWIWKGKINKRTGYGHKQIGGRTLLAHRWVYSIFNGHVPTDRVIDHTCSNRSCVNPSHLEVVSQQENCRRGFGTKLDAEKVAQIKGLLADSVWGQRKVIADRFGVSPALISDIKYGRAWADVEADNTNQKNSEPI